MMQKFLFTQWLLKAIGDQAHLEDSKNANESQ